MKKHILKYSLHIVLALVGIITILPFAWMILSSFKSNEEISALHQTLLPKTFTLENYVSLQSNFDFLRYFANSVLIAVIVTVLVVYISCLCGFVLSKYKFRGET